MAPAQTSSVFSRKIVNLFAGMAYGSPDLPRILRDLDYRCHAIEATFSGSTNEVVNPELVLCSDAAEHTLLVEAKSGANLNSDQLERYISVDSEALEKKAFTSPAAARKHNILVIGLAEHETRLKIGSALAPSPERVLCVAEEFAFPVYSSTVPDLSLGSESAETLSEGPVTPGLRLIENRFEPRLLNEAFSPILEVDWDLVPNSFLPVDHEAEDWEFAEFIIPELIAALLNSEATVDVEALASSFIRHWEFIGRPYKNRLLERIRNIISVAAQQRFAPFLTFGQKGSKKNEVLLRVPEDLYLRTSSVATELQQRFRDLMRDLNSPQTAMIYRDE